MAEESYVFISYSSRNIQAANKVTRMLSDAGIAYWRAPEMIPAGSNYAREIPRAIADCKLFILLVSKDSQKSIWVEKEIDCAVNSGKLIVPLHIDDEPLNELFRFYLNNVQSIFFSTNQEEAFRILKQRVVDIMYSNTPEKSEDKKKRPLGQNTVGTLMKMEREQRRKSDEVQRRNYNSLNYNIQPVECQYCGGGLTQVSLGVFRCTCCNRESYDYYNTVRNYLEKYGPHSALEIQSATGVPQSVIMQFLEEEMLEIPKASSIRLVCSRCGAKIRSGSLCDACKAKQKKV